MGLYKLWIKSTQSNKEQELFLLEEDEKLNVHLYQLKTYFWCNHNRYSESPTYHVWSGDKWIYAGLNYEEGYSIYAKEKECLAKNKC